MDGQRRTDELERVLRDLARLLRRLLIALGDMDASENVYDLICTLDIDGHRVGIVRASARAIAGLSRRQREVLWMLGQGQSNKQIARKLGVGQSVIEKHIHRACSKLGTENRAALCRLSMLIDPCGGPQEGAEAD